MQEQSSRNTHTHTTHQTNEINVNANEYEYNKQSHSRSTAMSHKTTSHEFASTAGAHTGDWLSHILGLITKALPSMAWQSRNQSSCHHAQARVDQTSPSS